MVRTLRARELRSGSNEQLPHVELMRRIQVCQLPIVTYQKGVENEHIPRMCNTLSSDCIAFCQQRLKLRSERIIEGAAPRHRRQHSDGKG